MVDQKTCPRCFRLIGEGTRSKIIQKLRKKSFNVSEIEGYFSLSQPTISYHLRVLEKNNIVFSKKRGREVYYFFNKKYPCKKCFLFKIPFKT